jgi:signal transduction histidine kinase
MRKKTVTLNDLPPEVVSLLELISSPDASDDASRHKFLDLACRLVGSEKCAVLLWLYDSEKDQYLLDRYCNPSDSGLPPPVLEHRYAKRKEAGDGGLKYDGYEISLDSHPEIQLWFKQHGFTPCEFSFPLVTRANEQQPPLGYVQLVSSRPVADSIKPWIKYLVDALAGDIERNRSERRLAALEKMRSRIVRGLATLERMPSETSNIVDIRKPTNEWLQSAAHILYELTDAELCLVFRQERDLGLRAVATSPLKLSLEQLIAQPTGLTSQIAKERKRVRISNFYDVAERRSFFGTDSYDQELLVKITPYLKNEFRAWMVAPVTIGGHAIAVIMLLNKTKHLAKQFSETDQSVLHAVCDFLAKVIPSVETYNAMVRISETVFSTDLSQEGHRQRLFELLAEMLPGVASAMLYLSYSDFSKPEPKFLGGEMWFENAILPLNKTSSVVELPATNEKRYYYISKIPNLERGAGLLVIGLRRNYITDYEKQVLNFLCAWLGQTLRAEESIRGQIENIVQVHHAIRSGLAGINHINVAMRCYEIYKRTGDISELQSVRFRKALERASLFAKKIQILMEESRFLLGGITRESLRIGAHSLSGLIREVVRGLAPVAERRRLDIQFNNQIPRELDMVQMDRALSEIVVFNLVDNAVKYSHRGKTVVIVASIERGNWVLKVTDYGVHMKESDMDAIFQPFERRPTGRAATTRPGAGLGLTIAKAVVEAHSGKIEVESTLLIESPEPFAETSFIVKVPRSLSRKDK